MKEDNNKLPEKIGEKEKVVKVTLEQMQKFSENLKLDEEVRQEHLRAFIGIEGDQTLDLSGLNLEGMDLENAMIIGKCWFVNFGKANLKNVYFIGNQMLFCNFAGSDVLGLRLQLVKANGSVCPDEDFIKEGNEIYTGNLRFLPNTEPQIYFNNKENFLEAITGKKDLAAPFNYRQALLCFAEQENNYEQRQKYLKEAEAIVERYGERALYSHREFEERYQLQSETLGKECWSTYTALFEDKSAFSKLSNEIKINIINKVATPNMQGNDKRSWGLIHAFSTISDNRWQKQLENEKNKQENQTDRGFNN